MVKARSKTGNWYYVQPTFVNGVGGKGIERVASLPMGIANFSTQAILAIVVLFCGRRFIMNSMEGSQTIPTFVELKTHSFLVPALIIMVRAKGM